MPVRSWSRAEQLVTQRRRLEAPLLWLVLLSAGCFSVAQMSAGQTGHARFPVFHMLAILVGVAINYWATRNSREVSIHRILVNLGVLAATGVLILEVLSPQRLLILALGDYVMLVLMCKLFERKQNRDYAQMILLSLMLMVSTSVINDGPWLMLFSLGWIFLVCYTTMVLVLKSGLDQVAGRRLSGEALAPDAEKVAWNAARGWPRKTLLTRSAGALFVLLLAGVGMFLVAPRLPIGDGDFLSSQALRDDEGSLTGFAPDVLLGRKQRIYESVLVVGRVRNENAYDRSPGPMSGYLRGMVFTRYARGRWSNPSPGSPITSRLPGISVLRGAYFQEVEIDASLLPRMYMSYPAVSVESRDGRIQMDRHLVGRLQGDKTKGQITYKAAVWSQPLSREKRGFLSEVRGGMSGSAQVEVTPRVAALARQWCSDLLERRRQLGADRSALDLEIARRLSRKLTQTCSYTLDLTGVNPNRDPLEDFLFYHKRGHCEYFASAHVVMCEALGVRARLAVGFLVSPAPDGQWAWIRENDAHAWTEVFTDQTDWVVFDATPPRSNLAIDDDLLGEAQRWWHGVEYWWQRNVLSFDETSREKLAAWLYLLGSGLGQSLESIGRPLWTLLEGVTLGNLEDIVLSCLIAVALVCLPFLLRSVLRLLRRQHVLRQSWQRSYRDLPAFLVDLLKLFEQRGLQWDSCSTLAQTVENASKKLPLPARRLRGLVELYHQWRWSGRAVQRDRLRQARREVRQMKQELKSLPGRDDPGRSA